MSRVAVVIPAGGAGSRMGQRPKFLLQLAGQPLLQRTLQPFLARADVVEVVVALPVGAMTPLPDWLQDPRIHVVAGGAERMDSVRNALAVISVHVDVVVIHDAARPLCSPDLIERVLSAAQQGAGALPALPATDTVHEADAEGRILRTPERSALWQAQTPQAFPRQLILDAHRRAVVDGVKSTDDAGLVAHYGGRVQIIKGEASNLKITVPEDLVLAEALLAGQRK